ncbi:MAG TPA: hypothetical protein VEA99_18385 [Gemmatimonadaceae bacterium]|nr:hypothetical protein [Gemmatimonadaceae bacterium]
MSPRPFPQRAADLTLALALVLLVVAALLALGGCATASTPRQLGAYDGFRPRIDAVRERGDSLELTVAVERGASVALLEVIPGGGVTLLHPAAGDDAALAAGTHTLVVRQPPGRPDSLRFVRAPSDYDVRRAQDRRAVQAPGRVPLDERMRLPSPRLLLVVTERPLSPARLRDALRGVTVPLAPEQALNAVGKLVRSVAGGGAWAAVSR